MIKLFFLFGALFAVLAHAQEQWEHPDSRLGISVFNGVKRPVTMKMYSQNRRGKEWGPYEIAPYGGHAPQLVIDCKEDEKICMGAWDPAGEMMWGLGDGARRCENCCIRCNGRQHAWQLQGAWSGFLPGWGSVPVE